MPTDLEDARAKLHRSQRRSRCQTQRSHGGGATPLPPPRPRPATAREADARRRPADSRRPRAPGDLSPSTARYAHAVLRIAIERALKSGRVIRNVAALVDPPKQATSELHPLSTEQVARFWAAIAERRLEVLLLMAPGTGLRVRGAVSCVKQW